MGRRKPHRRRRFFRPNTPQRHRQAWVGQFPAVKSRLWTDMVKKRPLVRSAKARSKGPWLLQAIGTTRSLPRENSSGGIGNQATLEASTRRDLFIFMIGKRT